MLGLFSKARKVRLVVFDADLRATVKNCPVTEDGRKIQVKRGGKLNFNPSFNNDTVLFLPRRSFLRPWHISHEPVYFAANGASECVNFHTEPIPGPDPEAVMRAAENKIIEAVGKQKTEKSLGEIIIIGMLLVIILRLFGAM